MVLKTCTECGQKRPLNEYHLKRGKLRSNCKWCVSKYTKEHYKNNKDYYLKKATKNRKLAKERLRQFVYSYYKTHSCVDCGESDPVVLEFDHVREKYKGIAIMVSEVLPLNKIKEEIAKCDVVCANCHKRRTAKTFNWYKQ